MEQLKLFEDANMPEKPSQQPLPRIEVAPRALHLLKVLWGLRLPNDSDPAPKARIPKLDLQRIAGMRAQELDLALADVERAGLLRVTHTLPGRNGRIRRQNTYYFTPAGASLLCDRIPVAHCGSAEIRAAIEKRLNGRCGTVQVGGAIIHATGGNA